MILHLTPKTLFVDQPLWEGSASWKQSKILDELFECISQEERLVYKS
jgi:hypothetical protein